MKRKRIILFILCSVLLFFLPIPTAYAHPGRTDRNGGHTDRSSGKYHYHHGYEAHDHYDVDRNGSIDCPYDFDDQTGRNSESSSDNYHIVSPSFVPNRPLILFTEPTEECVHTEATNNAAKIPPENDCISGDLHYWTGSSESIYAEPTNEESSIDFYTFLFLINCLAVLLVCFFILNKLRPKQCNNTDSSDVSIVPVEHRSNLSSKNSSNPPLEQESYHSEETDCNPAPVTLFSKERYICQIIWQCTYYLSNHLGIASNPTYQGYLWAVLFYIVVKHIRRQDVIDKVYSHFHSSLADIAELSAYPNSKIKAIQKGYQLAVPLLSICKIDPRTPDGVSSLWDFLSGKIYIYKKPPEAAKQAFLNYSSILISNICNYYDIYLE